MLDEQIQLQGFKKGITPIKPNKYYFSLLEFLNTLDLSYEPKKISYTTKAIVAESQSFLESYFKINPVTVLKPNSLFIEEFNTDYNQRQMKDFLKKHTEDISPFNLKISFTGASQVHSYLFDSKQKKKYKLFKNGLSKNTNIVINYISLFRPSITSPIEYTHEIVHTQIDNYFGSYIDAHNKEVISIFLEKLHAYELGKDEYNTMEIGRLVYLRNLLSYYLISSDDNEKCTYIISTLKAEILFYIYQSSNSKEKKKIIKDIQKIFNGLMTVEELLDKYNITEENELIYPAIKNNLHRYK